MPTNLTLSLHYLLTGIRECQLIWCFCLAYIWQTDAETTDVARKLQSWRSRHSVPEVYLLWFWMVHGLCVYILRDITICTSKGTCILINLHTSQGKHRGTGASCSSQGSTTRAVGEIVCLVWYFGQLMHATGFTGNMNMCVTTSVYCTQGCRQMDETTHSESSTVVSSIGHLEHVRISESLVLSYCLTIPL